MQDEVWKPVPEVPDAYEVSNTGRVRRTLSRTNGKAGRLLRLSSSRDGYAQVGLSRPGKNPIGRRVHRLVWEAFQGGIPDGHVINHINGVKTDNRLENLEVVTCRENTLHAFRVLGRSRPGEKLCAEDAKTMRERRAAGETIKQLASDYGVTTTCASSVCTGKTWRHAGGPITPSRRLRQTRNEVLRRISDDAVRHIIQRYREGESSRALADEIGVSDVTVLNWVRGTSRNQG
jgi:uncharacterized protein (DUF433 family)